MSPTMGAGGWRLCWRCEKPTSIPGTACGGCRPIVTAAYVAALKASRREFLFLTTPLTDNLFRRDR